MALTSRCRFPLGLLLLSGHLVFAGILVSWELLGQASGMTLVCPAVYLQPFDINLDLLAASTAVPRLLKWQIGVSYPRRACHFCTIFSTYCFFCPVIVES
jgi:hypothetical protein